MAEDESSFHSLSDDTLTTELCTQTTEASHPPALRQRHPLELTCCFPCTRSSCLRRQLWEQGCPSLPRSGT